MITIIRPMLLITLLLAGAIGAAACPSDFDEFGAGGAVLNPSSLQGTGFDAVEGPAGVTYVAAAVYSQPTVLRYSAGGLLDGTFGDDGLAQATGFGAFRAIAVQHDGSILAAGSVHYPLEPNAAEAKEAILLARFNSAGSLDPSFGNGGVTISEQGFQARTGDMVVRSDGGFVVVGRVRSDSDFLWAAYAWFYDSDGTLEFARNLRPFRGAVAHSVVEMPDDTLVVAGFLHPTSKPKDAFLARLSPDGTFDTTFGRNGVRRYGARTATDLWSDLAIDGSGRLYAAGSIAPYSAGRQTRFFVRRFLASGDRDESYGRRGMRALRAPGFPLARTSGLAVSDAGEATFTGLMESGIQFIARFTSAGDRDLTFGFSGVKEIIVGSNSFESVALTTDEKIIAAGQRANAPSVIRLEGGAGTPDCILD